MARIIGWDVGGAHLKAALIVDGLVADVVQHPSPIWQGLSHLHAALEAVQERLGSAPRNAVTMTGELADNFAHRAEGVATLSAIVAGRLDGVVLYGGRAGWIAPAAAAAHVVDIASANWHATAALVSRQLDDALLIDMGSTTTDIIPIADATVAARGYTDAERLATGELVYTGLTRSHPMSLGPRAPFAGGWTELANEYFTTMADVRRIIGDLPHGADQMQQIDGRGQSDAESTARLARVIGRDASDAPGWAWRALASWFAELQVRRISDGAHLVLSTGVLAGGAASVVGAGIGREVVRTVASRIGLPYVSFDTLLPETNGDWLACCAPAVAVGVLAGEELLVRSR